MKIWYIVSLKLVLFFAGYILIGLILSTLFKHREPEYNLHYTDALSDCSESVRQYSPSLASDGCVIIVSVTNPFDHDVVVDYAEISGPADYGGRQRIKIFGADGRTIDARMMFFDSPARSTLPLRIFYDYKKMTRPVAISIDEEVFSLTETQLTEEDVRRATQVTTDMLR